MISSLCGKTVAWLERATIQDARQDQRTQDHDQRPRLDQLRYRTAVNLTPKIPASPLSTELACSTTPQLACVTP